MGVTAAAQILASPKLSTTGNSKPFMHQPPAVLFHSKANSASLQNSDTNENYQYTKTYYIN
jgi:hypothetical protein